MLRIHRTVFFVLACFVLSGCQLGYLFESSYNHLRILTSRTDVDKVLNKDDLSVEQKRKLLLAREAKSFAEIELGLKKTNSYNQFVDLKQPYVSYIVVASDAWKLDQYKWNFPFVGSVPYKGYFKKEKAEAEAKTFDPEKYDTMVRGVTAYSTLGWFNDPVLSSMLELADEHLVNTIIHETVHATLYIKSRADFNERMATFFGDRGAELFFKKKEGVNSPTLKRIQEEAKEDKLFSEFISREIDALKLWYESTPLETVKSKKPERLQAILSKFDKEILPQLTTNQFKKFGTRKINNAYLLSLKTYVYDQSDFNKAFEKTGRDFKKLLEFCKGLEKSKDPEADLKAFAG